MPVHAISQLVNVENLHIFFWSLLISSRQKIRVKILLIHLPPHFFSFQTAAVSSLLTITFYFHSLLQVLLFSISSFSSAASYCFTSHSFLFLLGLPRLQSPPFLFLPGLPLLLFFLPPSSCFPASYCSSCSASATLPPRPPTASSVPALSPPRLSSSCSYTCSSPLLILL